MTLYGSKGSINIDLYLGILGHRLVNPWPASPARASGIANAPGFAKDASIAGKFIRGGGGPCTSMAKRAGPHPQS